MDRGRNQAVWIVDGTRLGTELGKRDIRNKHREISGRDIGKAKKAAQKRRREKRRERYRGNCRDIIGSQHRTSRYNHGLPLANSKFVKN